MDKIKLYKSNKINKEHLLLFYIINDYKPISINDLLENFGDLVSLDYLKKLEELNLINIDYNQNIVDLKKEESLTSSDIDKIRVILNREIKTFELEKIKKWFLTYSIKEIEDAIYQTVLKGIDNFNYIEKVLFSDEKNNINEEKVINKSGQKVIKKFDLFT